MQGSYLGDEFGNTEIIKDCNHYHPTFESYEDFSQLCETIAKLLADGNIIGWFQGRMEFGPRALGNRSILGDPRNNKMQKKMNVNIKYRESFRPFAPSVLIEDSEIILQNG